MSDCRLELSDPGDIIAKVGFDFFRADIFGISEQFFIFFDLFICQVTEFSHAIISDDKQWTGVDLSTDMPISLHGNELCFFITHNDCVIVKWIRDFHERFLAMVTDGILPSIQSVGNVDLLRGFAGEEHQAADTFDGRNV